jgi:hypothetical protein
VVRQLEKLYDIHEVSLHDDHRVEIFDKLGLLLQRNN